MQNRVQTAYLVDPNHHFGINLGILSLIVVISLVFSASLAAQIDDAPSDAPIRVLFIGNSHTTWLWSLPRTLEKMEENANPPITIDTEQAVAGGFSLEMHWNANSAVNRIQQGGWDFVVLQGGSSEPLTNLESLKEFTRKFDAEIKKTGAQTMLYMTWAWQNQPEMIETVSKVYTDLGTELDAIVVPAGLAWKNAIEQRPDMNLYYTDGSHTNAHGMVLTASVFYSVLTRKSPLGLSNEAQPFSGALVSIPEADAAFLQNIAFETVKAFVPELFTAVSSAGKIAVTWGHIKQR